MDLDGFSSSLTTSVRFITNRKEQGRELGMFFPFENSLHQLHIFFLSYWPGFKSSEVAVWEVGMFWRTMSLA